MNEIDYLEKRLEDQISWYDKKSMSNQNWYKTLRIMEIIAAALIPFFAGFQEKITGSILIVGILGILIAVSAAISSLFKYHENWIQYRTIAEQLKHEKFMYLTETEPYNNDDKFSLLVERVESLISKENSTWSQYIKKQSKTITKE